MKTLIEKRAALLARCKELTDGAQTANRSMTEEERTEFRSKMDEAASLKTQIADIEAFDAEQADQTAIEARAAARPAQARPAPAVEVHDNAEDAPFRSFGEQLIAIRKFSETPEAIDPRLRKFDLRQSQVRAAAGLNEQGAADGGFLVMTDTANGLMQLAFQDSQLWSKAKNIPLSGNSNGIKLKTVAETSRANGSRWGGIQVYMAAEAAAATASKPTFDELELNLRKLMGLAYMTDEVMDDASALETVITEGFREEFAFKLDDLAFRGTGAGMPLGILNAACTTSVAKETSQAAATILYANVSKMRARMLPRAYARANWYVNVDTLPQIEQLVIPVKNNAGTENVGGNAVNINGAAANTPYGTLLGRPVVPIEHCETLGTVGDVVLADMSYYLTISKGMKQASSIHVKFLTDEVAFRFTMRIDGQPALKSAITPFKGAGTLSPFVTLATR